MQNGLQARGWVPVSPQGIMSVLGNKLCGPPCQAPTLIFHTQGEQQMRLQPGNPTGPHLLPLLFRRCSFAGFPPGAGL